MVGSQHNVLENEDDQQEYESLCKMIQWASEQSSPVLSIDFPSALGEARGMILSSRHSIFTVHSLQK